MNALQQQTAMIVSLAQLTYARVFRGNATIWKLRFVQIMITAALKNATTKMTLIARAARQSWSAFQAGTALIAMYAPLIIARTENARITKVMDAV
jgi:hypothetical protein